MSWERPKTDWRAKYTEEGRYQGDWFNVKDYNRIKNNIYYLYDLSKNTYNNDETVSLGTDKAMSNYFYADEINAFVAAIRRLSLIVLGEVWRSNIPSYSDNGPTMTFEHLNQIEKQTVALYNKMLDKTQGHRRLAINFGMGGEF